MYRLLGNAQYILLPAPPFPFDWSVSLTSQMERPWATPLYNNIEEEGIPISVYIPLGVESGLQFQA